MRLIVTRPAAQAAAWVDALLALGVDAQSLPLLGIAALDDTAPLHAAWRRLDAYMLVVFVSANAVQHFFRARPHGATWPVGVLAGATGPGTSAALRAAGLGDAAIVEPPADAPAFDSEALWARLAARDWTGRRVLTVRGEGGRDWLADTLRAQGAQPEFVAAYRRVAPSLDDAGRALLQAALAEPALHTWLFSSSEAAQHLPALAPGADWSRSRALASHSRIARTARQLGFGQVEIVAPTLAAVAGRIATARSIQSTPL